MSSPRQAEASYGVEFWALPRDREPVPLGHATDWKISPTDSDWGSIEFSYPPDGPHYELLSEITDDDVDLDVEVIVSDGLGREHILGGILYTFDQDDGKREGLAAITGHFNEVLFDEIRIPYNPDGDIDEGDGSEDEEGTDQGETYVSGTAGQIVREFIAAARARSRDSEGTEWALPGVWWTFTDSHDSNGEPWRNEGAMSFSPGQTYHAMLGTLRGYQLCEWRVTHDRQLVLANVDTLGVDHTVTDPQITLEYGRDYEDAPRKHTVRDAITALLTSGKNGIYTSATDPTAQARRGRQVEGYHSFGNTSGAGTLEALTQTRLATSTTGTLELSHALPIGPGSPLPLLDFDVHDWILSDTRRGTDRRRVKQLTVQGDSDDVISAAVTLNAVIDEHAVREKKRLDALESGAAVVGTSTPPPEVDDGSIPRAPTGLVATSLWYMDNEGAGAASVTASWSPVPDARVDGYIVEWRYQAEPLGRVWRRLPQTDDSSLSWSPVAAGQSIAMRVAAINKWGRLSDWSDEYLLFTEDDGTPPPVTSAPTPYTSIGLIVVPWDGKGAFGEPMPGDFLRIEVHRSVVNNFTPDRPLLDEENGDLRLDEEASETYRGEMRGATQFTDEVPAAHHEVPPNPDDPDDDGVPGVRYYYRFVAVDRSGNASDASAQGDVMPRGVQGDEIESLAVSKLRAGVIRALVGIGNRLYAGDPNGAGWEGDAAGFRFFSMINGVRTAVLEFTAATAQLLITGTFQTGRSGRRAALSGEGNELRFYPSADETRFARLYSFVPGNHPNDVAIEMRASRPASSDVQAFIQAMPDTLFMSASRDDSQDRPYTRFNVGRDWIVGEKRNPATQERDGGYFWLEENTVTLGMRKFEPNVDAYLWMGRNPDGGAQFFDLKLQPSGVPGATAPSLYASNQGQTHFGLRLANGNLSSGFQYDGNQGWNYTRGFNGLQIRNPQGDTLMPVVASNVSQSSSAEVKKDFAPLPEPALEVLRRAPASRWRYTGETADPWEHHVGPVAEDLPTWLVVDLERPAPPDEVLIGPEPLTVADDSVRPTAERAGVDLGSLVGVLWEAVRQLDSELDALRSDAGGSPAPRRSVQDLIDEIVRNALRPRD